MDNEMALRLFVNVVEENSISRGGARLSIPQSSASRMLSKLEDRLDARLLQRSTRRLQLTEAGRIYFERARQIVTELDEAALAIRDLTNVPSGLFRLAAPASFAQRYVAPYLSEFREKYPDITFGLALTDRMEDLIGQGFDVAIRLGQLPDSSLVATRLAMSSSIVCASPLYLERRGAPKSVQDLENHDCLLFRGSPGTNNWKILQGGAEQQVRAAGPFYCDSGEGLLAAALNGLGVCMLPIWLVGEFLADGRLQPVFAPEDSRTAVSPVQAVMAHRQHIPAKTRVFVDFLRDKLSSYDWT
ncbi:hypothetical protein ACMU_10685 [Actibacterium mucosum KCTC 23349]|uniref:HTH lysR-type domain-containing protein n=1 Tax=Actibacterium mucosum KCTC 23349 TaxID=1454373 RepID=A0A037ZID6_9RHOB|nr:LysR family transcriptional regulator [Actibacterium mucosum]KAJ56210.1 hypothetical protein ACMU_10685 [Actibacterium mucosum KCTC 23349]